MTGRALRNRLHGWVDAASLGGMSDISRTMTEAVDWLVAHWAEPPAPGRVAAHVGMEAGAFEDAFCAYVGLSPERMVQAMARRRAGENLSGGGRAHDPFVTVEAATPGEMRGKGAGLGIQYGYADSPFGELILAASPRGLCWLGFRVDNSRAACLARIRACWPRARLVEDSAALRPYADAVCAVCAGAGEAGRNIPLHLFGTDFQVQIWRAMLKIPARHFVSYEGLGAGIGRAGSARAVGGAVGANPVSLLIPCHRVIRKSGVLDNYGWGSARKKALLGIECAT